MVNHVSGVGLMIGGGHHLVILDHHFLLGPIPVLLIIIHHLLNEGIIRGREFPCKLAKPGSISMTMLYDTET